MLHRKNESSAAVAATLLLLAGQAVAQGPGPAGPDPGGRDEYLKSAEQRFLQLDGDKDGYVTQEEFRAAREAMRERRNTAGRRRPSSSSGGPQRPGPNSALPPKAPCFMGERCRTTPPAALFAT